MNNVSEVEHFEGCGGGPGVTEYLTGREHVQVVDFGQGTLKLTYGLTFRVTEVSDDPTVPSRERQGSDERTLHLLDDGSVIFHESFHDLNTGFGDTFAVTTFVGVGGEVRVEHDFVRNPPPSGC